MGRDRTWLVAIATGLVIAATVGVLVTVLSDAPPVRPRSATGDHSAATATNSDPGAAHPVPTPPRTADAAGDGPPDTAGTARNDPGDASEPDPAPDPGSSGPDRTPPTGTGDGGGEVSPDRATGSGPLATVDFQRFRRERKPTPEFARLLETVSDLRFQHVRELDAQARAGSVNPSVAPELGEDERGVVGAGFTRDEMLRILATPGLGGVDARFALHWLTAAAGNEGADVVLPYLSHPDRSVQRHAWIWFGTHHAGHVIDRIVDHLPPDDTPPDAQDASLRFLALRDVIFAALRMHPSPATVRWLLDTGTADATIRAKLLQRIRNFAPGAYPPDAAATLAWMTGVRPSQRLLDHHELADAALRRCTDEQQRGIRLEGGRLRYPPPDASLRLALEQVAATMREHHGSIPAADDKSAETLRRSGLAGVGVCLRVMRELPLASRTGAARSPGAGELHADVRHLASLAHPALAGELERAGLEALAFVRAHPGPGVSSMAEPVITAVLDYYSVVGDSGSEYVSGDQWPGFAFLRDALAAVGNHASGVDERRVYETVVAVDDPALIPAVLATGELRPSRWFARTMTSLTRHTFGTLEANMDARNWRAWLIENHSG